MIPTIGLVGYSNSGKTTLASLVIRRLQDRGRKVAVIKHDAHGHYKEAEETDSGKFIRAGADAVVIVSPEQFVRIERKALGLEQIISSLFGYDVALVEGFKSEPHPKIAVFRTMEQAEILMQIKGGLIAVACSIACPMDEMEVPVYDLNDIEGITALIERQIERQSS